MNRQLRQHQWPGKRWHHQKLYEWWHDNDKLITQSKKSLFQEPVGVLISRGTSCFHKNETWYAQSADLRTVLNPMLFSHGLANKGLTSCWFGCDDPTNAQARHPPTLSKSIQNDNGILIDVIHKLCSWNHSPGGVSGWHPLGIDVSWINFIQHQGTLRFSCDSDPILQLFPFNQLTCWIARIGQQEYRQTTSHNFTTKFLQGDGEIVFGIQRNGDGIDGLELTQELGICLADHAGQKKADTHRNWSVWTHQSMALERS